MDQIAFQNQIFFPHLRKNAFKSQIGIAISVYVLGAIIKKRLIIKTDLYPILQIWSLTLFEKIPLNQILTDRSCHEETGAIRNQFNLMII